MARISSWNGLRRTPIRQRSRKMADAYEIRVPSIREAMERGQLCEASSLIADVDLEAAMRCQVLAVDWHERKTRARGGSILDPANRCWACRPCHRWITDHPIEARAVNLVLNSWDPDP